MKPRVSHSTSTSNSLSRSSRIFSAAAEVDESNADGRKKKGKAAVSRPQSPDPVLPELTPALRTPHSWLPRLGRIGLDPTHSQYVQSKSLDALSFMHSGTAFLKVSRRNFPLFRMFCLSSDNCHIKWEIGSKSGHLSLSRILRVSLGQLTETFSSGLRALALCSFSIYYQENKDAQATLDLVAPSSDSLHVWVAALRILIDKRKLMQHGFRQPSDLSALPVLVPDVVNMDQDFLPFITKFAGKGSLKRLAYKANQTRIDPDAPIKEGWRSRRKPQSGKSSPKSGRERSQISGHGSPSPSSMVSMPYANYDCSTPSWSRRVSMGPGSVAAGLRQSTEFVVPKHSKSKSTGPKFGDRMFRAHHSNQGSLVNFNTVSVASHHHNPSISGLGGRHGEDAARGHRTARSSDFIRMEPESRGMSLKTSPVSSKAGRDSFSKEDIEGLEVDLSAMDVAPLHDLRDQYPLCCGEATNVDALYFMRKGGKMIKFGRRGGGQWREIWLSSGRTDLCWSSASKTYESARIKLSDVTQIVFGQVLTPFAAGRAPQSLALSCFSLVYVDGEKTRSLDLCAASQYDFEVWTEGLSRLMALGKQRHWRHMKDFDTFVLALPPPSTRTRDPITQIVNLHFKQPV